MKILYLPLKKEWYEMIERGDKREKSTAKIPVTGKRGLSTR